MRITRPGRLASACRSAVFLFAALTAIPQVSAAATIAGRVLDPDGRPVPRARVFVTSTIAMIAEQTTDDRGAFSIGRIADGRYQVLVVADGFQADPVEVAATGESGPPVDVHLRLSAISESIVVSASHVDVPLSQAADSITVITAADLEARQIERVSDALRLVPGLTATRSGGRGAITSLFPRGGGSNYTLVLVDGIRANSFGGGFDFGHLSVADIDRIEVVRGPDSALFGSDAIGAVVQVITRRGGAPRVEGLIEGGSDGTARGTVGASGSRGAWTWGGGAESARSTGYTGVAPASGERVTNDDDHLSDVSGSLGWSRPNGAEFRMNGRLAHDERGYPGPYGSDPIGAFPGVDRVARGVNDTRQIGARFSHAWSPRLRQRVDANYSDIAGLYTSAYGPSNSGTHRFEGRVQEDAALNASFAASAGANFVRESGTSTYVTGLSPNPLPIHRSVTGLFGELRYAGAERLFVTAGLRLEHLTRDEVEANVGAFTARPAFGTDTVDSLNPKVSASYRLARSADGREQTRVRASAGTGIRPPDVFEIAFTDNPNLKPERSRTIDFGVEQQFAGGAYVVSATGFFNHYNDLIITVGTALGNASRYQTDNIANSRASGVELSGDARLPGGFTAHAAYAFVDSEMLAVDGLAQAAPAPFKVGDPLLRRPRHQGSADLIYHAGRATAFLEATSRSQALDVEPNYGSGGGLFFNAGYVVANAGVSVRVARGLEVYARVLNLADRRYEETLGYPALRRGGIVGLRVAAGK